MRQARRRAGAAAEGLFPSTRSGATAAALEKCLRVSGGSAPQRHRICAGWRGHGTAPFAAVRSKGGETRPLEHAAIFSCHGGGRWGGARRQGEGLCYQWRWREQGGGGEGFKGTARRISAPSQRQGLIRIRFSPRRRGEREMVQVPGEGFIRSLQIAWMENGGQAYGGGERQRKKSRGQGRRRRPEARGSHMSMESGCSCGPQQAL
jgi:hypothetical protein